MSFTALVIFNGMNLENQLKEISKDNESLLSPAVSGFIGKTVGGQKSFPLREINGVRITAFLGILVVFIGIALTIGHSVAAVILAIVR